MAINKYCTTHERLTIAEKDDLKLSKIYYEISCSICDFKTSGYRKKDDLNPMLYELINQGHAKSGLDRKHLSN